MLPDFIFMLTRNDKTINNALEVVEQAIDAGATHIGFKDIGISFSKLTALSKVLQQAHITTYLEVVSLDAESELKSAEMAIQLGVDYLLGGTRPQVVAPLLKSHALKYFPFVGKIQGHPSKLCGSISEIMAHAISLTNIDGVDGLDLLAYRFTGDVPALIKAVNEASLKPIIIAGSIDRQERIEVVKSANVKGFTIGTAIFENKFNTEKIGIKQQIRTILSLSKG